MEIVTKIAPLALAFIMLGLGLGLTTKDFLRVINNPRDFAVGFVCQLIITIAPLLSSHLLNSLDGTHASNVKVSLTKIDLQGEKKILFDMVTDENGRINKEFR